MSTPSGLLSARHVEPVSFTETADSSASPCRYSSSFRQKDTELLQDQAHGLKDETVMHVFRLQGGKVARFDIQDAS